jgi:hypothetical protein
VTSKLASYMSSRKQKRQYIIFIYNMLDLGSHGGRFEEYHLLGETPYSLVYVHGRLGGTCYIHLQGRRVNQANSKKQAASEVCLDYSSILKT